MITAVDTNVLLDVFGIAFDPADRATAATATAAWAEYRRAGGQRERVVADFVVGAHGTEQADRLLTRDRGFYGGRFPGLVVLDPSVEPEATTA